MKVVFYTNEYPPYTYGGAGVAVEYLTRELTKLMDVEVRCFGDQRSKKPRLQVTGFAPWKELSKDAHKGYGKALEALSVNLEFCKNNTADIVHCHTWYTNLGGFFTKILHKIPFVMTTHSLEPLRPWKREQLGNAYDLSSWIERNAVQAADAVIAVSGGMKKDILSCYDIPASKVPVIHNGIDLQEYRPSASTPRPKQWGIEPGQALRALRGPHHPAERHHPSGQRLARTSTPPPRSCSAPEPRTPRRSPPRWNAAVARIRRTRKDVIWIDKMLPKTDIIELYSHAAVFCCPSIYEPFGIINIEAMACGAPVVASATGGILEVVVPGKTGLLVPFIPAQRRDLRAQRRPEILARPGRGHQPRPAQPRAAEALRGRRAKPCGGAFQLGRGRAQDPAALPEPGLKGEVLSRAKPAGLGARYFGPERCEFLVWAPAARKVELRLVSPKKALVPMETDGSGYHWAVLPGIKPGTEYLYRLDGKKERPDPASRCQPHGVHGPSAVEDPAFTWHDQRWKGLPLERHVIYELHVGAFSKPGTFAAIMPHLDTLADLGVTALCLMPVAQNPGKRNWGYDGVYPFAVQQSYGGTDGLKRLIDAAHGKGLAVLLDVVHNHLGPEGNYLRDFGPYFTAGHTPWGEAMNLDGPGSDEVRRYFIESVLRWAGEFHADGLRLDAIHALRDFSARPFVEELTEAAHGLARSQGRVFNIFAESILNDPRVVTPSAQGGWGCDAQWLKDFQHSLHVALTGEDAGYYADYSGLADLARAYRQAYVFTGQYSAWRKRSFGRSAQGLPASRFLVYSQDHDEAGNRPQGERLAALVDFEALKLAAAAVALSPYIPLLFMGEEYAETAPFFFFTDHSDRGLAAAVRRGRERMFAERRWPEPAAVEPNSAAAFGRCKLDQRLRREGRHAILQSFYKRLYALRREHPALAPRDRENLDASLHKEAPALVVRRRAGAEEAFFVLHFGKAAAACAWICPGATGSSSWIRLSPSGGGPAARPRSGWPAARWSFRWRRIASWSTAGAAVRAEEAPWKRKRRTTGKRHRSGCQDLRRRRAPSGPPRRPRRKRRLPPRLTAEWPSRKSAPSSTTAASPSSGSWANRSAWKPTCSRTAMTSWSASCSTATKTTREWTQLPMRPLGQRPLARRVHGRGAGPVPLHGPGPHRAFPHLAEGPEEAPGSRPGRAARASGRSRARGRGRGPGRSGGPESGGAPAQGPRQGPGDARRPEREGGPLGRARAHRPGLPMGRPGTFVRHGQGARGVGGPRQGALQRLVRALPALDFAQARPHGTFKDLIARLPYVAEMGFDVLYLPPIHPIGKTHRKGKNNALKAGPGRSGQPLGHRRRDRRAQGRPPASSAPWRISARWSRRRRSTAWRSPWTSPCSARRTIPT